jgi:hypothetical protein
MYQYVQKVIILILNNLRVIFLLVIFKKLYDNFTTRDKYCAQYSFSRIIINLLQWSSDARLQTNTPQARGGFYPSWRTRCTRWTSGSLDNGEAAKVGNPVVNNNRWLYGKRSWSARLWQKAAVLITWTCRSRQVSLNHCALSQSNFLFVAKAGFFRKHQ